MHLTFKRVALATILWAMSGSAFAQCENLRVVIRNQVWPLENLDAFCRDYDQLKREVARLAENLARLERENRELRARLDAPAEPPRDDRLVLGKP